MHWECSANKLQESRHGKALQCCADWLRVIVGLPPDQSAQHCKLWTTFITGIHPWWNRSVIPVMKELLQLRTTTIENLRANRIAGATNKCSQPNQDWIQSFGTIDMLDEHEDINQNTVSYSHSWQCPSVHQTCSSSMSGVPNDWIYSWFGWEHSCSSFWLHWTVHSQRTKLDQFRIIDQPSKIYTNESEFLSQMILHELFQGSYSLAILS